MQRSNLHISSFARGAAFSFLLLVYCSFSYAQGSVITEEQYHSLRFNEYVGRSDAAFTIRLSVTSKETSNQIWKRYSETISEFIKPDRSRIRVIMWYRGFEDPRSDVIRIDEKVYSLHPDGHWRTDVYRLVKGMDNKDAKEDGVVEYRNLGYEVIEGKRLLVVQKSSKREVLKDGSKVQVASVQKDWIDDGKRRTVKTEFIIDSSIDQPYRFLRSVTEYDYDTLIKIEAPAISEVKKTPTFDQWGVPNGRVMNPSNGVGSGGSQGSGQGRGLGIGTGIGTGKSASKSSSPTQELKMILKPYARYTDAARSAKIEGSVTLKVTFLESGNIGHISVVKGLPHGLTEEAISAAKRIQFEPARLNGKPVTVTKQIDFPFSLF